MTRRVWVIGKAVNSTSLPSYRYHLHEYSRDTFGCTVTQESKENLSFLTWWCWCYFQANFSPGSHMPSIGLKTPSYSVFLFLFSFFVSIGKVFLLHWICRKRSPGNFSLGFIDSALRWSQISAPSLGCKQRKATKSMWSRPGWRWIQ